MVAADQHHVEVGHLGPQPGQKTVELLPGAGRGIGGIKQIARHQQSIDLPLLDGIGQPVEEAVVFEAAFMAMELMTKVPVGGMQDFHEKSTRIQERCQRHPMETR